MSEEQKKEVAPETQQTEEVKVEAPKQQTFTQDQLCLLYTSPSPRD